MQRDLVRMLQMERATLSGIVTTLVRKGLVDQTPDSEDQRQRMLRITRSGTKLWKELPDPIGLIMAVAFDGADATELAIARRVLQAATQRLNATPQRTHLRRKSSMPILVTGGTGLVGSRLLRRFVDAGVDCRALVRPGKEVPAGATPVEGDLLDADSLKHAVEGVSAIVHLAAVFRTQKEDDIWRANLDGTKNLIAAAKAHAPQVRFVMASTGLVYDADASHPGLEEDTTNPKLAYPASKIAAENELRNSGLNWSILRLGFVYGDGDGHLASVPPIVARFKWHPAKTFSLIHQRDVAGAVELALTGAMDGHIVNICDDAPTTLYEMASLVGCPIEPSAEPLTDPWMGRMDGSRLRSFGFQPTVPTVYQAMQQGIL